MIEMLLPWVKTGTVIAETEVGYISLRLEARTVPVTVAEIQPTAENSISIEDLLQN